MVTIPRTATYQHLIDWLSDGTFGASIDDVTGDVRATPGFSCRLGMDQARPLAQPMVSDGSYELDNRYPARKYSPEFAGSNVYQIEQAGRSAISSAIYGIEVDYDDPTIDYDDPTLPYDGVVTFPLLTGAIDQPGQHPDIDEQSVGITIHASLSKLQAIQDLTSPLYQNIRTDQALTYLLDAAGWPAGKRALSIGDSTFAWWWLSGQSAFQAAIDILNSEGVPARLYETPSSDGSYGVLHFENRNYRTTQARSTTSQAVIYDQKTATIDYDDETIDYDDPTVDYDGGGLYRTGTFGYDQGEREIVNKVSLKVNIRAAQSLQAVSTYGSVLSLSGGQSFDWIATSANDPWTGAIAPVATIDYVVTSGPALDSVAITVLSATTVKVTFVAGAGATTIAGPASATTGPQLRAQPVTVIGTQTVTESVSTTSSRIKHGERGPDSAFAPSPELQMGSAQAIVDALVAYSQQARAIVTWQMINRDSDHLWMQLATQISDRVTIVDAQTGLSNDVWTDLIAHDVTHLGLSHLTTFAGVRTNDDLGPGLWDQGLWNLALWGR